MIFNEKETIAYPFTAAFDGTIDDMGDVPTFLIHFFSLELGELVEVNAYLDLVSTDYIDLRTTLVGTIFVPAKNNILDVGEYRMKLSIQLEDRAQDLLYVPLTIAELTRNFEVANINRNNVTQQDFQKYLSNVVDPGIKLGYKVKHNYDSYYIDVEPGVMFTPSGRKIEHFGTIKAGYIRPAGALTRVDAICVYFDDYSDPIMSAVSPQFRIIEGPEVENAPPPAIPPHYTPIAWALLPGGSTSCEQIRFSRELPNHVGKRPFFNVPSVHTGDGSRDIFEFPTEVIKGTSIVGVDGVEQVLDEDYIELDSKLSKCKIRFIDGVPEPGQRVSISGQRYNGPYYDYNYSIYATADEELPMIRNHSITNLAGEYLASSFSVDECYDTSSQLLSMKSDHINRAPGLGWSAPMGYYMYFNEVSNMVLDLTDVSTYPTNPFDMLVTTSARIIIEMNLIDMPVAATWTRVLSIGPNIRLYATKSSSSILFALDYGSDRVSVDTSLGAIPDGLVTVEILLSRVVHPDNPTSIGLVVNSVSDVRNIVTGIADTFIEDKWTIGNNLDTSTPDVGNGIRAYISKFLIYNV